MEKRKGFVGVRREEENRGEWVGQRSEEGEGSVEEGATARPDSPHAAQACGASGREIKARPAR